ncbi:MAG: alpha/beta fold hydrolase [Vicinamibacterales bacterium]
MSGSTIFRNRLERERMRRWRDRFVEAAPVAVEEREVHTAFGETGALVAGPPDAPPLVVLHGALASAAHVVPELDRLLTTRRVHVLDVVGQSPASADRRLPMDDDSYGRLFAQACAGLGLGDVDVYGVSWGGFVALRAAMLPGSRVRRLALLVPAGFVSGPAWTGLVKVGLPLLLYRTFPSRHRLRRAVASQFTTPTPEWTAYFGDALRSYRLDVRLPPLVTAADAARITCPVLVFGAEHDLSFPGRALVARVQELLPHAETELLEGSLHCPPQTAAFRARMAGRIERFLGDPALEPTS